MRKSTIAVSNYRVYVDVYNTKIWSDFKDDFVAEITINEAILSQLSDDKPKV